MSTNDDDDKYTQRAVLIFLGTLVGLVTTAIVVWAAWLGLNGDAANGDAAHNHGASEVASQTASETQAPSDVAPNEASAASGNTAAVAPLVLADDESKVVVDNGVVKFYFAVGKADLATGADEALKDVIAGVKDGKKAVISGYHDSTGTIAVNEEVAKKRAFAVKDALVRLGVAEDQIELVKPQVTEGTGSNAEARRVEVVLQ